MPRHLTLLAALLLALPAGALAAAADTGDELVLVAEGAATGTVTLPRGVTQVRYTVTTRSPYAAVVLAQEGELRYGAVAFPEPGGRHRGLESDTMLPAGRLTVSVLAKGPVTFRFRGVGLRGRHHVRLRSPLRGATAVVRDVPAAGPVAADDIRFATSRQTLVFHRVVTTKDLPGAHATAFCTVPAEETCPFLVDELSAGAGPGTDSSELFAPWPWKGAGHATYQSTHTPDPAYTIRHWLIAVPVA